MKLLSAILAILVLFLSVQPACAESGSARPADTCCEGTCTESDTDPGTASDTEERDCEGCNPFQTCSCCIAAAIMPQPFVVSGQWIIPIPVPVWSTPGAAIHETFGTDFWQPPRRA